MANEQRVREDYKTGTVLDAPLAFDASTMTSDELTAVREVTSEQHMTITLDPHGDGNGPETAWIIAHEASSDTATLARGRETTTGVEHAADTPWAIGPGKSDFMQYVAADDELPDEDGIPYPGQPIYDVAGAISAVGAPSAEGPLYWNKLKSEWMRPWNEAWGLIKRTPIALETLDLANGITNVISDWNLAITADLVEGRDYELLISGSIGDFAATERAVCFLTDAGNNIRATLAHLTCRHVFSSSGTDWLDASFSFSQTVTGSDTYKLRGLCVTSAGFMDFGGHLGRHAYMKLYDRGPWAGSGAV